jgi:WD40 repeat protein
LSAFTEQDEHLFFGRDEFAEQLVTAVKKHPLVPVIGASGSGKSSVVFARLIPRLRAEGTWLIEFFRPGFPHKNAFSNLASALLRQLETQITETEKLIESNKLSKALEQSDILLSDAIDRTLTKYSKKRFLLVIDQFEELYKPDIKEEDRHKFLNQILDAIKEKHNCNFTLLLTLRADFIPFALSYQPFAEAWSKSNHQWLLSMNRQELKAVIEQPVKDKVKIADKLTERILNAVEGKAGNLPLLEFALTELWTKQVGGELTYQAYEEIGGVENALANHAQKEYENLNEAEQQKAQKIFIQLVYPGQGTEDTRRLATRSEVGTDNWDVVAKLADARLVVTGSRVLEPTPTANLQESNSTSEETVEVIHETLITKWKILKDWIDGNREFRTWQERLRVYMSPWIIHKKDKGYALQGVPLTEAKTWRDDRENYLSPDEREYIDESWKCFRDKEFEERILVESNETLADANRKAKLIIKIGTIIGLLVAVVFGSSAKISFDKQQEAQKGTDLEQQSNSIIRQFSNNQIQGLLSAIQAGEELKEQVKDNRPLEKYPTIRPISVLREVLDKIHEKNTFNTNQEIVKSLSFSLDSKYIATAGQDGTLRLWDLLGKEIIKPIKAHDGTINGVNSVSFNSDGKTIATSGEDGKIKIWDLFGNLKITLLEKEGGVKSVNFSPDNKKVATAGDYGIARIWDLSTKSSVQLKGYKVITINSITFSPDGKKIATAGYDGTVRFSDLSGNPVGSIITPHNGKPVYHVSFSPNGQLLATAGEDNVARIWNLSGQQQKKLEGHQGLVTFVSFSPDGKHLVTTSEDGTARVWDFLSGQEIYQFKGHGRNVLSASFSPDGKYLASAGKDGKTRIWNLSDQQKTQTTQFKGHQSDVNTLSISRDGTRMASGDNNGFVRLWDLCTNKQIGKEFKANNRGRVLSLTFSPDSKFLISGGEDGIAKIWDLSGQLIRQLKEKQGNSSVSSLSFSSDGKYIATTGANQTAKIWSWDGEKIAKEIATLEGHKDLVYQVSFHPKQELIATGAWDGTIGLWKLSDNKVNKIKVWPGHQGKIRSLSFSSDGKYFATADDNSELKVWDLSGQEKLKLFSYQREIQAVAFSSDGKYIATGGKDGTVKLWDWLGRQVFEFKIEKIEKIEKGVWDISFSSDGHSIVAGGDSGQLQSWPVKDLDQLLAEGCDWLKGYLENSGQTKDKLEVCRNKDSNSK